MFQYAVSKHHFNIGTRLTTAGAFEAADVEAIGSAGLSDRRSALPFALGPIALDMIVLIATEKLDFVRSLLRIVIENGQAPIKAVTAGYSPIWVSF